MPKKLPPTGDPVEQIFIREQHAKDSKAKEAERLAAIAGALFPHLDGLTRDKPGWESLEKYTLADTTQCGLPVAATAQLKQTEGCTLSDKDYLARLEKCYVGISKALKEFGLQTALAKIDAPLSPKLDAMLDAWRIQLRLLDLAMHGNRSAVRKDLQALHSRRQDGVAWWFFRLAEQGNFPDAIWEAAKSEVTGEPTPAESEKSRQKTTDALDEMRFKKSSERLITDELRAKHEAIVKGLVQARNLLLLDGYERKMGDVLATTFKARDGQGEAFREAEAAWISLADAEKISGINRGVICKAANAGKIKDNGQSGKGKRKLDSADFNRWHLARTKLPEKTESDEKVKTLLGGANP